MSRKSKGTGPSAARLSSVEADARAARDRIVAMFGPGEELWVTLFHGILEKGNADACAADEELARATGLAPGAAQILCSLAIWVARKDLTPRRLVELASSDEAMQLCKEVLERGSRTPAGCGEVLQFPSKLWRHEVRTEAGA